MTEATRSTTPAIDTARWKPETYASLATCATRLPAPPPTRPATWSAPARLSLARALTSVGNDEMAEESCES